MRTILLLLGLVLLLPLAITAEEDHPPRNPMYVVSVSNATLNEHISIMGYDVRVRGGTVLVAPLLPKGWEVTIRNFIMDTPPWHSTMNATCLPGGHGVGLNVFDQFLVVEEEPSLTENATFHVEVGLITTKDGMDFGITWLPDAALSMRAFTIPEE